MIEKLGPGNTSIGDIALNLTLPLDSKVVAKRATRESVTFPQLDNTTFLLTKEQEIILTRLADALEKGEDQVGIEELVQSIKALHTHRHITHEKAVKSVYTNVLNLRRMLESNHYYIESTTTQIMKRGKKSGGYALRQKVVPSNSNNKSPWATEEQTIPLEPEPNMPVEAKDQKPNRSDIRLWRSGKDFQREQASETKSPQELLGLYSTLKVLSNLLDGKLGELPSDIEVFLQDVLQNNPYSKEYRIDLTLETIFNTNSKNRLERFFKVTFQALVGEGYNSKEGKEEDQEERLIREKCQGLRNLQYDQKRIVQEVLEHFGIKISPAR